MDQSLQRELEERNQRIIDAIIEKSKKVCPNSIALIGIGGSFYSGDIHAKSDLDLLIVINDDEGWKLGTCFILGDVAHDIYCTSWASLEQLIQYTHPYVTKLLDIRIVYCTDDAYLEKYRQLSQKVKERLEAPLSKEDYQNAEKFLANATKEYANVMLEEETAACRYAMLKMLCHMEHGVFLLNKAYVKRGVKRIPEEIGALKSLPINFVAQCQQLLRADTAAELQQNSTLLLRSVRTHFEQVRQTLDPKKALTAEDVDGSYEEIFSNWRNKMHHAAECGDIYLSLMTAMSSQQFFFDEIYGRFQMDRIDVMKDVDPKDLAATAQAFDRTMEQYRKEYDKLGKPVRHYATLDEFEKDYLK